MTSPLAQLIIDNGHTTAADADEFDAIHAALAAPIETPRGVVSMRQTIVALTFAGADPEAVFGAFRASAIGEQGLAKLGFEGLDFSDQITAGLVQQLRPAIGDTAADTLLSLATSISQLTETTVEELRTAWRTYRLHQRATNARAVAVEKMTADMTNDELAGVWADSWAGEA